MIDETEPTPSEQEPDTTVPDRESEPEPPATEDEIIGLDHYFEKGLRNPEHD